MPAASAARRPISASSKTRPDPATRSLTVWDTSTEAGGAAAAAAAAVAALDGADQVRLGLLNRASIAVEQWYRQPDVHAVGTGTHVQAQLRNLGSGGSTLRFGGVWTTAMVAQVALTVICLPPAVGISSEAIRDRQIRAQFPAEEYLAVRLGLDQSGGGEANPGARLEQTYAEFERRLLNEPDVRGVTFADRLPGMGPAVMSAEVEVTPGSDPVPAWNLWTAAVGPQFFETFDVALVAGRDFHDGDRAADARTVEPVTSRAAPMRPSYWTSVARIGVEVARALEYAHGQGVPAARFARPSSRRW